MQAPRASPAWADAGDGGRHGRGKPGYPPSQPSISITKTRVMVGGTAVVHASGCAPTSIVTVSVTVGAFLLQTLSVAAHGVGQVSTPIHFTAPTGTQVVAVTRKDASRSKLIQTVAVTEVDHLGIWADHDVVQEHSHIDFTVSGQETDSRTRFDRCRTRDGWWPQ